MRGETLLTRGGADPLARIDMGYGRARVKGTLWALRRRADSIQGAAPQGLWRVLEETNRDGLVGLSGVAGREAEVEAA